jgi:hypothetical protein
MNPVEVVFWVVVEYDVDGGEKKATGSLEGSRFVTQMGM